MGGGALSTTTTFLTVTPQLRLRLMTTIENLIGLLDDIDGDNDLEDDREGDPSEFEPEGETWLEAQSWCP